MSPLAREAEFQDTHAELSPNDYQSKTESAYSFYWSTSHLLINAGYELLNTVLQLFALGMAGLGKEGLPGSGQLGGTFWGNGDVPFLDRCVLLHRCVHLSKLVKPYT